MPVKLSFEEENDVLVAPPPPNMPLKGRKILLTGITPLGVNSPRRTMYTTDLDAIVVGLRNLGATVDWRQVEIGEDLSSYSDVIVEIIEPAALAARYLVDALWVLSQREDAFVHISDCKSTFGINRTQFKRFARVSTAITSLKSRRNLAVYEENAKVREGVDKVIQTLASWSWPWRLMYSGMAVGDVQKLKVPSTEVLWYDPTSHVKTVLEGSLGTLTDEPRKHQWIAPFLTDRSAWLRRQEFSWPLIVVGGRSHAEAYKSLGRLPEAELIALWKQSFGFINIPYSYAGSNWWRAKYVFAACLEAISIGSEVEHKLILGDSYRRHEDVEGMSDDELAQLGAEQSKAFFQIAWTSRDFNDYLVSNFSG